LIVKYFVACYATNQIKIFVAEQIAAIKMGWQPGQSGNPKGRAYGTKVKSSNPIWAELEEKGDIDPAVYLSSIVSDQSKTPELRASAATALLPYKYPRIAALPPPRYVQEPIPTAKYETIEQAQEFLALISQKANAGELELQCAIDLSTLAKNWILSKQSGIELDLKVATQINGATPDVITIQGGLPPLPGANVTMPLNGHSIDPNLLVEHEPAIPDPPAQGSDESVPQPSPSATGPHGPQTGPNGPSSPGQGPSSGGPDA
jgi:hypothetical protein